MPAVIASAAIILTFFAAGAASQTPPRSAVYPSKPVRLVLPVAPGGTSDGLARIVGPRLSEALGQPIVIDNRPGAGGNIAAELVTKSVPDGYTLFMGQPMLTTHKSLYARLPFDPLTDFSSITLLGTGQYFLVVNPSVPAKTLPEFIAFATAQPGRLNFGSSALGAASHLAGELLKSRAGIDMTHVAYKGGGPAVLAVLTGEIQCTFGTVASALTHVKAGKLRGIAATGLKRSPFAPDLPTFNESGFPGFNVTTWDSLVAPARTSKPVIARIHSETVKVLRMPDVRDLIRNIGYEPAGSTPEELDEFMRTETAVWAKVIKNANIRLD